ncbi:MULTISPECIES: lysozyme [unclassified Mesorhizobium]|uniref:lysozyme n=1 Tax=unclassified Mesorhizobium TaxID=325217 RepID=UPI000FCBC573|nr:MULTISPECIES: lysozyme [unclassified Mesorhizobium]TGP22283.1 glycoside hydrolase [Mesorhizobium sp. M1D.F.Ca.ET.231.01.1.1]TGP24747.1 glycoside hydrolase [Mesorhizobium sp. M1D.F.Ca.ET.234.01.1.1]TGS37350.1 glycoside hydrolase [Mesorhizobium sp. M1D.F.Ca.ET.184.01.1.1]TGS58150.1 glycoside hydrolase [Mesorhizobium sp. M1D.F.Ca.ET.183.01.1.1]
MPMNKIRPTGRAGKAIAAVLAMVAVTIGGVRYINGTPDDVVLASDYLVNPWEGEVLKAYLDRVADPPIWTICAGDTQNVKPGMVETPAGCKARLERRMTKEFRPALVKCIPGFNGKPISWRAMMDSLAWNIGSRAACNSRAAAFGAAGKYHESCIAATAFNKAGGRVIIGLVKRREMGDASRIGEAELCVSGLD